MSFNIVLTTNNVYATNTTGKDYTWAYDFSGKEDGDYMVSFDFQCGNISTTPITDFNSVSPTQFSCDFGSIGQMYLASSTSNNITSRVLGLLRMIFLTTSVGTYIANIDDNFPLLFKNINKSSSFIRIKLLQANGTSLVNQNVAPWSVYLKFQKVPPL